MSDRGKHSYLCILTLTSLVFAVNSDTDLGQKQASVCREGSVNITWLPQIERIEYEFIDLYYTRRPENGKKFSKIILTSWRPSTGWKTTSNPRRFSGRIFPKSSSATTSFRLENVVRIDNGLYELSARMKNGMVLVGTFNLTVYYEENYFPKLIYLNNSTDTSQDAELAYKYRWLRPDQSPSSGIKMTPLAKAKEAKPHSCNFDHEESCEVTFKSEDLNFKGSINFQVEYLFPANFSRCDTLDEPPTNLAIVIPHTRLGNGIIAGIVVGCVVIIVIVIILVVWIVRRQQENESKLTQKQYLDFVKKCIDGIQDCKDITHLKGAYRKDPPPRIIKAFLSEYKKEKGDANRVTKLFHEIDKTYLCYCVKEVLRAADEEWLPKDVQEKISKGVNDYKREDDTFKCDDVRNLFRGSGRGAAAVKREILAAVFRHFDWFLSTTNIAPNTGEFLDVYGLALCIAPHFFTKVQSANSDMTSKWISFIENVIRNVNQIFPPEDDPEVGGDKSTHPLIQKA